MQSIRAFDIIERFTAAATWLVPVVLLAGIAIAVLLLPSDSALRELYGELLIAKVVGFLGPDESACHPGDDIHQLSERGRARRHLLGPCATELFASDTAAKSEFS
jgi:hypothetical protein